MSSIKNFFRHCPNCGKRFEIRLVGKKEIEDAAMLEGEKKSSPVGRYLTGGYQPLPTVVQEETPVMVDVKEFQYTYKCKHCGHQWSEVHEKERTIDKPEGYTGD